MAKDKFVVSTTTELIGYLDYDQDERLVVEVVHGKGDSAVMVTIDLLGVLNECVGQSISLKLADEEDKVK